MIDWNNYFYYDETSPSYLRWKVEIRRGKGREVICVSPHDAAGFLDDNGYYVVGLSGAVYKAHRIIWQMYNDLIDLADVVDHKDGNTQNNALSNLRLTDNPTNRRNMKMNKDNSSGVTGVSYKVEARGYTHWRAKWHGLDGKRYEKSFSTDKYGNDEAFRLACEYRAKMIAELNEQGAGYTERHGT